MQRIATDDTTQTRQQNRHRRYAVVRRRALAAPCPLGGGVHARLRAPTTAKALLRTIPALAIAIFTT